METSLHQYLKESTRRRHEASEQHPFQGALAQGRLPFEVYKQYMVQLYHLHDRFEARLKIAARQPEVGAVVVEDLYQLPFLSRDLEALGVSPQSAAPLEGIKNFTDLPLWQKQPASLLGVLYVLLGSKHGGKFIAHQVKESYALGDAGWLYFNPYGDTFRPLWQNFTAGLNQLPAEAELRSAVLEAADTTFETFVDIGGAIWQPQSASTQG